VRKLSILDCFVVLFTVGIFFLMLAGLAHASETNGTIDTTYKYAWGENTGWINFGCDNCSVAVTDSGITGYAWSSQYGWINLNPDNSGVSNTDAGVLSGYAWGSIIGWINFSGVTINSSGEFVGYATVDSDSSQISFNCVNDTSCSSSDFKVKTDWRPASARTSSPPPSSSSRGGGSLLPWAFPDLVVNPPVNTVVENVSHIVGEVVNSASRLIANAFSGFLRRGDGTLVVEIPKIAPIAFHTRWNLLPVDEINAFVFAPLPREIRVLAEKFPELGDTLKTVGIERLSDVGRLTGVTFNVRGMAELEKTLRNVPAEDISNIDKLKGVAVDIPGISGIDEKIPNGSGQIALIKGVPLSEFPAVAKANLPAEFVFARTEGESLDLNIAISVGSNGKITQKMSSLPGQTLKLVIKPIGPAKSVTGYFVFKSPTPKVSDASILISRSSLTGSAIFAMDDLVEKNVNPLSAEEKLILSSFEYTDPDHDGIYTANVSSPAVPGEYELITIIEYQDPELGTRQMRMINVVDPEGYVFERQNGKETRIPNASVSLYTLNASSQKYELWHADKYMQENPQVTDVRGTYSFLVPAGTYYFKVSAPGYKPYEGEVFSVNDGDSIHQNIELRANKSWVASVDWTNVFLVGVLLLLVYNLYNSKLKYKLFKNLEK